LDLNDLRYSVEHIWVRLDENQEAALGLCEDAFGNRVEVRRLQLTPVGEEVFKDDIFGRFTTSKPKVFHLYALMSGEVIEINEDVLDAPDMILEDPYQDGWLLRMEPSNTAELDALMTREEYEDFLTEDIFTEPKDRES